MKKFRCANTQKLGVAILNGLEPTAHSEFGIEWGADADIISRMRIREIFRIE